MAGSSIRTAVLALLVLHAPVYAGPTASPTSSPTSAPGLAGGDPITFSPTGEKSKFWLPYERYSRLLNTPDLSVFAKVFPGPSIDYQWFDEFLIKTPAEATLLKVALKRSNETVVPGGFKQLDVSVAYNQDMNLLETLPESQELFFGVRTPNGDVRAQVGRRHHTYTDMEFVHIETDSIALVIESRLAGTEFPNDMAKQEKYIHLDMFIMEMRDEKSYTGILPQLWGMQPRTPEVEAMLIDPSKKTFKFVASDMCTE